MARSQVQPGAIIDGFTIGECVHSGGMATLWSVIRPDIAAPLLMKIPLVCEGEDPAAIVSFIIGAGQSTMLRSLLGSVSARVAAEAACTVTVVRPPRLAALAREDAKEPSATRVASVTNPSSSRPV